MSLESSPSLPADQNGSFSILYQTDLLIKGRKIHFGGLVNTHYLNPLFISLVYPLSRNVPGCINLQNEQ